MKRFKSIVAIIAVLTMLICIGCGKSDDSSKDKSSEEEDLAEVPAEITECLKTIKEGLQERWDITDQNSSTVESQIQATMEAIDKELSGLSEYKDKEFEDKVFGGIVNKYIAALESQKAGCAFWTTDAKQYETLFYVAGYDVRSECLNQLVNEYGFAVDQGYSDTLTDLLSGERLTRISPGDTVNVNTEFGEVEIAVNAMKRSNWKDRIGDEGDFFVGLLECVVYNKSYSDPYNQSGVSMNYILAVSDLDYMVKDTFSSGYDYQDFIVGAGGFFELPEGSKAKIACPYCLAEGTEKVYLNIGNEYEMFVDVE